MGFILIDLYTQLDAVNSYTSGWNRPHILAWLRRFGKVYGPYHTYYGQETWSFCSSCGPFAGFYFNEQNELVIPYHKKGPSKVDL